MIEFKKMKQKQISQKIFRKPHRRLNYQQQSFSKKWPSKIFSTRPSSNQKQKHRLLLNLMRNKQLKQKKLLMKSSRVLSLNMQLCQCLHIRKYLKLTNKEIHLRCQLKAKSCHRLILSGQEHQTQRKY
jgi:hypothetical protein